MTRRRRLLGPGILGVRDPSNFFRADATLDSCGIECDCAEFFHADSMAIMALAASAPEVIGRIDVGDVDEGQESCGRLCLNHSGKDEGANYYT